MEETITSERSKWFRPPQFPQWYKSLSSNFRRFFYRKQFVDVIFHCLDSKQVVGHQMILGVASPILHDIFMTSHNNYDDVIHISIPEVSHDHLAHFVESIYLGSVPTLPEVFEGWKYLVELFQIFRFEPKSSKNFETLICDESKNYLNRKMPDEQQDHTEKEEFGPTAEQKNLKIEIEEKTSKISFPVEDFNQIQIIQTDRGDMVIVPWEDQELKSSDDVKKEKLSQLQNVGEEKEDDLSNRKEEKIREIRQNQERVCQICNRSALDHKVQYSNVGSGSSLLQITGHSGNLQEVKFVYQCCVADCPFKLLRNARAFNYHISRHEQVGEAGSRAMRFCPLCSKSKMDHKNRNPTILEARNYKKGSLYKCCMCKASKLSGAKKFFEHVENHVCKKFVCPTCQKGFSYQHILDEHSHKVHGLGQNDRLSCTFLDCDFESKYRQTLAAHVKEKHEGKKKVTKPQDVPSNSDLTQTVTCPTCHKELKKWYYHQFHRKNCSSGNILYQCDLCFQDGFVNKVTLNNHIKAKHSDERPFQCEYCPAKYATAMSLSGHRSRKHNLNKAGDYVPKKMFPCGFCGRLLTSRTKLAHHVKTIHDGAKDFKCPHCDKKFTSKSNMKIHEGVMHTGVLPYKCDLCDKMFTRKQQLKSHSECAHGLATTTPRGLPMSTTMTHALPSTKTLVKSVPNFCANVTIEEQTEDEEGEYFIVEEAATEEALLPETDIIIS